MVGFQPHDEIQFCHERPFVTLFNSQKNWPSILWCCLYLKWKRLVLVVVNLEFFFLSTNFWNMHSNHFWNVVVRCVSTVFKIWPVDNSQKDHFLGTIYFSIVEKWLEDKKRNKKKLMIKNCPNNYCFKIKFLLCTNVKNWLKLTVIKWHGQCTKIETFQGKLFFQIILSVLWPQVEKCNSFLYNFANFFPSSSLSHSNLRSQRSHSFSMLSCILCVWNNNACLQIVTSLNCIW